MPETIQPPEANALLHDIFNWSVALFGASVDYVFDSKMPIKDVVRFGYGWKDGYYMSIQHTFGQPPWYRYYKKIVSVGDQHVFRISVPIDPEEKKKVAFGIIEDRVQLYLTKKAQDDDLKGDILHDPVWWRINRLKHVGTHRHANSSKFPNTLQALSQHIRQLPDIGYIYTHDLEYNEKEKIKSPYVRTPFRLHEENVKVYIQE